MRPAIGFVRAGVFVILAAIVFVTVMPIEFRPSITADPDLERSLVFAGWGGAMGFGYRRRWLWMLAGALALTGLLEVAQGLTATRHGRLDDAVLKGLALVAGTLASRAIATMADQLQKIHSLRSARCDGLVLSSKGIEAVSPPDSFRHSTDRRIRLSTVACTSPCRDDRSC